jgi:hypothetical protein
MYAMRSFVVLGQRVFKLSSVYGNFKSLGLNSIDIWMGPHKTLEKKIKNLNGFTLSAKLKI